VPARVGILGWVIPNVAVPVQVLRVGRVWDNGIRADEPTYARIVVPGVVEVQARLAAQPLAGELLVRVQDAAGGVWPPRPGGADDATGRAQFGAGYYPAGVLHGRVLRSPNAPPAMPLPQGHPALSERSAFNHQAQE